MPSVHKSIAAVILIMLLAEAAIAAPETKSLIIAHRAHLVFDLAAHKVVIVDEVRLPAGLKELRLGAGFKIIEMVGLDNSRPDIGSVVRLLDDEDGPYQQLQIAQMGMHNGGFLKLTYEGIFHDSVADVAFSREKVGGEIKATISEEGIYLAPSAGWLVSSDGALATHELAIDTPAGFETVTQGERTLHQPSAKGLHTNWLAIHPSDGLTLVANRFVVHEEEIRPGLVAMTFFREDDPRLRAT